MIFAKIRSTARSLFIPNWTIPIALLLLVILSYGLRALSLGFYWDDLPYLWYYHRLGPEGIITAFTGDRPFLSFIYNLTLGVLGSSTQAWQIFALIARWLCSLGFWWVLALTWPNQANKGAWAAILFTVYPGFTQQWISVIYGQAFLLYACVFFSIGISLWLARHRQNLSVWVLITGTILAVGLSAFTMFSTEYFFGLELVRPILLWLVLKNSPTVDLKTPFHRRIWQTTRFWLPYLLLMISFVIWRGFIHVFPSASLATLQGLDKSPWTALLNLTLTIIEDLVEASLAAWGQPLQMAGFLEASRAGGLKWLGVILGTGIIFAIYLNWLKPIKISLPDAQDQEDHWPWQAILVGIAALLVAGWPFWITGLPMRMGFPQDRYSLPLAPGICLIFVGVIDWVGGKGTGRFSLARKAAVVALAAGLAAGFHSNLALQYRQDWNLARSFFWQIHWRAPSVQPGTLFLTGNLPFLYYEDDSLSAPLNWTLEPDNHSKEMSFILFDMRVRSKSLSSLNPDRPVKKDFRATIFEGSTAQALVVYYAPPGCVHVLDPNYDSQLYHLPDQIQRALPYSNPQKWILPTPPPAYSPPTEIIGGEPVHRWCYYYQKAELARQQQQWEAILDLENESIQKGIRPEDPSEYLPFIEAYIREGHFDDAIQMTQATFSSDRRLMPALCEAWRRSAKGEIKIPDRYFNSLNTMGDCFQP